ncbi:MAG: CehA/McbA family metallohydrolase [Planctomycetes bacterium]|nr:CehA/McbA family metallohydrolase [Planctomycetota bacterium]
MKTRLILTILTCISTLSLTIAQDLDSVSVEGQPLAANAKRLLSALEYVGRPLSEEESNRVLVAADARDANMLQQLLDPHVLFVVSLNAESRVKVQRGPANAALQQAGYTPVLVKVINESTVTKQLRISSPQAGPVYGGVARLSMARQQQEQLRVNENTQGNDRFLSVEMFAMPLMTNRLSGLEVEYCVALIYSGEAGKREATIGFDVGQGNQDLGFRGETPVLFNVRPAVPVRLEVRDFDGSPTTGRFDFRDELGHVYPPQSKRLAPDLFFQSHVYRSDGEVVMLPPGRFHMQFSRGPEYRVLEREVKVKADSPTTIDVKLERWIDPAAFGYYSGDHHIHAAGCAHYTSPTQGVTPADMYRQVKGEGLNVGCVLTWGPCFDFQRQFFAPAAHQLSELRTILKYDLEISGFGSAALGHVCLLDLKDQTYPGSEGTSTKGWPTWTTPVMRWAKQQGGVTGYAHSASGLEVNPAAAAKRLLESCDRNKDQLLSRDEAARGLLPDSFEAVDRDRNGALSERELKARLDLAADELPNLAIPEMNGVGAMEICVSTSEGVCDFISAMDTARIPEWNCWYHLLNCGFSIKVSGETDFPCMSGRRVGQGRVYVHMDDVEVLDFGDWCKGLAAGRSYVSDGFAHATEFTINGVAPGEGDVSIKTPMAVSVRTRVAFAAEQPLAVAYSAVPPAGRRVVGDTVLLHGERSSQIQRGGVRKVELVVNGLVVESRNVPADSKIHELEFSVPIQRSSWVALRQFPQMHTNPVNVIVNDLPIRTSSSSARWCIEMTKLLWKNRERRIADHEKGEAEQTFQRAILRYEQIACECPDRS